MTYRQLQQELKTLRIKGIIPASFKLNQKKVILQDMWDKTKSTHIFHEHDEVLTSCGFIGTIADVEIDQDGDRVYIVRLSSGRTVRYWYDLTMVKKYVKPEKSFAEECREYLAALSK